MYLFSEKFLEDMVARVTGPMSFRFILQPVIAIGLGIRDGLMDARAGLPPFIYDLIVQPKDRKRQLKSALHRLLTPIIVATILDAIAQYLLFKHVRPLPALLVGTFVMGLPYPISVATNGKQALEVVARIRPALILLDVMMPEMDGFETCRRLKAAEEWREIPVIFLTAKTETADIVQGFELGAVD